MFEIFPHLTMQSETLLVVTVAYLKKPAFILTRSSCLVFSGSKDGSTEDLEPINRLASWEREIFG